MWYIYESKGLTQKDKKDEPFDWTTKMFMKEFSFLYIPATALTI